MENNFFTLCACMALWCQCQEVNQLQSSRMPSDLLTVSDKSLLSDGLDILARNFFPKNSPPFANPSSFITQCKRLGPHLASFWFMQVHAAPLRVHSGAFTFGSIVIRALLRRRITLSIGEARVICATWCPHC